MPSYHIWIRKKDEDKWNAIANKPEWLHAMLNDGEANIRYEVYKYFDDTKTKLAKDIVEHYERTGEMKLNEPTTELNDSFEFLKDIVDDSTEVVVVDDIRPGKLIPDEPTTEPFEDAA